MGLEGTALAEDTAFQLWMQYQENKDVYIRNQLVVHYERMVKSIALLVVRKCRMEHNLDDIIHEGIVALIDAVERFDINRNVKFNTFATIKIKGAMLDFCRKQIPGYRRKIAQQVHVLRDATDALINQLMREPTPQEIADYLRIPISEYEGILQMTDSVKLISLEQILSDWTNEHYQMEFTDMSDEYNPESTVARKELEQVLTEKIKLLNEEQQLVLSLFYSKDLEINEIAEVLGWDPVRVSQVRYQAVRRLKRNMRDYVEGES